MDVAQRNKSDHMALLAQRDQEAKEAFYDMLETFGGYLYAETWSGDYTAHIGKARRTQFPTMFTPPKGLQGRGLILRVREGIVADITQLVLDDGSRWFNIDGVWAEEWRHTPHVKLLWEGEVSEEMQDILADCENRAEQIMGIINEDH